MLGLCGPLAVLAVVSGPCVSPASLGLRAWLYGLASCHVLFVRRATLASAFDGLSQYTPYISSYLKKLGADYDPVHQGLCEAAGGSGN